MADNSDSSNGVDEFARPLFDASSGRYNNPSSFTEWRWPPTWRHMWRFRRTKNESNVSRDPDVLNNELPIEKPDWDKYHKSKATIMLTWIGHATTVVQMDGLVFITDPIWSRRCSPIQFAGPKRYRDPPCEISDLPQLDFVLISHNHYDHLDARTVADLDRRFRASNLKWFVPMGLKSFFTSGANVQEMTWGESSTFRRDDGTTCQIVCVPAQHWSVRNMFNERKTLWCGWVVIGDDSRFYFAGDTGNCDQEFVKIGKQYGPFNAAAIPIGAYAPRWFMGPQHIGPVEAVKLHQSVNSKTSIGIHWGTFEMGSTEFYLEPRNMLLEEVQKQGLTADSFITINHGHTWSPDDNDTVEINSRV